MGRSDNWTWTKSTTVRVNQSTSLGPLRLPANSSKARTRLSQTSENHYKSHHSLNTEVKTQMRMDSSAIQSTRCQLSSHLRSLLIKSTMRTSLVALSLKDFKLLPWSRVAWDLLQISLVRNCVQTENQTRTCKNQLSWEWVSMCPISG